MSVLSQPEFWYVICGIVFVLGITAVVMSGHFDWLIPKPRQRPAVQAVPEPIRVRHTDQITAELTEDDLRTIAEEESGEQPRTQIRQVLIFDDMLAESIRDWFVRIGNSRFPDPSSMACAYSLAEHLREQGLTRTTESAKRSSTTEAQRPDEYKVEIDGGSLSNKGKDKE